MSTHPRNADLVVELVTGGTAAELAARHHEVRIRMHAVPGSGVPPYLVHAIDGYADDVGAVSWLVGELARLEADERDARMEWGISYRSRNAGAQWSSWHGSARPGDRDRAPFHATAAGVWSADDRQPCGYWPTLAGTAEAAR